MARLFSELENKMSPKAKALAEKKAKAMIAEMPMNELRQARKLSQQELANKLKTKQSHISQLEHRTDMYISTIRGYIEAMGGELKIIAHFPEGDVAINQFHKIKG